jgi:hypothetical protein
MSSAYYLAATIFRSPRVIDNEVIDESKFYMKTIVLCGMGPVSKYCNSMILSAFLLGVIIKYFLGEKMKFD